MESTSVFLIFAIFADFWWKDADDSITQGLCHVIDIFFWIFFRKGITVSLFIISLCVTNFREKGVFLSPICEQSQKGLS